MGLSSVCHFLVLPRIPLIPAFGAVRVLAFAHTLGEWHVSGFFHCAGETVPGVIDVLGMIPNDAAFSWSAKPW